MIYSEKVMEHFGNPHNVGVIADADGIGEVGNPVCGDVMKITIKVNDDRIDDIKFQTLGCGAAIATSSIVTDMAKGMTLADAVDLVLYAFEHGNNGDIFVQKAPAATIETLARAVTGLMGKPEHSVNIIGTRHGEKLYEALLSREEMACAEDMGDYFRVPPDGRDLNYGKFVDQGEAKLTQTAHGDDYNSHNTARLDVEGMTQLLLKLDGMQRIARGEHAVAEE